MDNVTTGTVVSNIKKSSVSAFANPTTPVRPAGAVPPLLLSPHATTLPSLFSAANALPPLEKICVTSVNPDGAVPP